IALVGIGGLIAYTYLARANQSEQSSYSFGAGQGGLGAGSTFTLLENSGNTVANINAPTYNQSKKETVDNYAPTTSSLGSDALKSSGGSGGFYSISSSTALQSLANQDAQLKKAQSVSGVTPAQIDAGYKFPAPTKSTDPSFTIPTKKTPAPSSGGFLGG